MMNQLPNNIMALGVNAAGEILMINEIHEDFVKCCRLVPCVLPRDDVQVLAETPDLTEWSDYFLNSGPLVEATLGPIIKGILRPLDSMNPEKV